MLVQVVRHRLELEREADVGGGEKEGGTSLRGVVGAAEEGVLGGWAGAIFSSVAMSNPTKEREATGGASACCNWSARLARWFACSVSMS